MQESEQASQPSTIYVWELLDMQWRFGIADGQFSADKAASAYVLEWRYRIWLYGYILWDWTVRGLDNGNETVGVVCWHRLTRCAGRRPKASSTTMANFFQPSSSSSRWNKKQTWMSLSWGNPRVVLAGALAMCNKQSGEAWGWESGQVFQSKWLGVVVGLLWLWELERPLGMVTAWAHKTCGILEAINEIIEEMGKAWNYFWAHNLIERLIC